MTVYELRKRLAEIANQEAEVVVAIRNFRNRDSVATSLKDVDIHKDIAILKGDLNG